MATSAWFNYNTYMANKLAQLAKSEPDAGWNEKKLLDAFEQNGFGGEIGAERHFMEYGQYEDVAPNAFFNATEYYRAKAAQYFNVTDPKTVTGWQVAEIQMIFEKYGMSAWSHYQTSGSNEGINPSNQFNSAKYMDMKLATMQATDPTMTMEKLEAIFAEYGYSALTHFLTYGGQEGEVQLKVVNGKIPAELSVPLSEQVESGGTNGKVENLTTGADDIKGTVFDDVINGIRDNDASVTAGTDKSTLNVLDTIEGGAGTDTLNIQVLGATTNVLNDAKISGVEIVNVRNTVTGATAAVKDASALEGVTNINTSLSTGKVTVTNIADGVEVGMIGNGKITTGDFEATYAADVTNGTLNLMNGVSGGAVVVSGADMTDVTVNSFGGENALTSLSVDGAKNIIINAVTDTAFGTGITTTATTASIAVKGAGAVDLGTLDTGVKSVDATGNTGGVDVVLGATAQSFTGGVGSDTVNIAALTLTSASTLVGGDGDGIDTLVVSGSTYTTSAFAAAAGHATGFEVLRLVGGKATTYDVSALKGATDLEFGELTANVVLTNVGNTLTVLDTTSGASVLTTVTRNDKLTSKDLAITLENADGKSAVQFGADGDADGLLLSGYETATINSLGGLTGTAMNKLYFNDSGNDSIKLKIAGDSALLLGTKGVDNVGVDATGFKHALDYTFDAPTAKTTVIGGDADDIFRTAAAFDYKLTLNGGAGDDTLVFTGTTVTLTPPAFTNVTSIEKLVWGTNGSAAATISTANAIDIAIDTTTLFQKGVDMNFTQTVAKASSIVFNEDFAGDVNLKLTSIAITSATTVTTGAGKDTVIVSAAATTSGDISISTGAGNDTINVTATALSASGSLMINGGAGKDTITLAAVTATAARNNVAFKIDAGDSTVAEYDVITGFAATTGGTAGMVLNFGAASADAKIFAGTFDNTLVTNVTNGLITFTAAGAALSFTEKMALIEKTVTGEHETVAFVDGGNSWVFNNDANGDSLVELAGVAVGGLNATATATNGTTFVNVI